MGVSNSTKVPVEICGSNEFGLYPKINLSQTWNLFLSDQWLVNYAGYKKVSDIVPGGKGRGIFNSIRGGFVITVIGSAVWRLNTSLVPQFIGNIDTSNGDVFIDENLLEQICIVDGQDAWIYDYSAPSFTKQTLEFPIGSGITFNPSYVCYHNTFFLFGSSPNSAQNSSYWYAYQKGAVTPDLEFVSQFSLQTKPDSALVVQRIPGRGNNVLVMGSTVSEVWTQVGGTQNYQRVSSFNIDNGVVSPSTVAFNDSYICFLSQSENNAPSISVTDGGSVRKISTDGIDNLLSEIQFPAQSTAFFYRQDGHLFYQLTFYNEADNRTLIYDFMTDKFFFASDENQNYYPAHKNVFFNKKTYFNSINDGGIYEMDTAILTYNYVINDNTNNKEIPRIRICKTIRKEDSSKFRAGMFTFWIEQGVVPENVPAQGKVDLSLSKNGNQSFGTIVSRPLNPAGRYRNQIRWHRLGGQCNELTFKLQFIGFQRFVCYDGVVEIY